MEDVTSAEGAVSDASVDNNDLGVNDSGVDSAGDSGSEEQIPERSVKFSLEDGPTYEITEGKIRKYYNIPPEEEISEKEWKMAVGAMKQDLRASFVRNKSTQMMKEYEQKEQTIGELISLLKSPESAVQVLEHLGIDVKNLSENYLLKMLEEQALPENERQLRERERLIQEREAMIQEEEARRQAQVEQMQMAQIAEAMNKQIIGAIEEFRLPKTEFSVRRIAHYMHEAGARGIDASAADVAPFVRKEIEQINRSILDGADPDSLSQLIGEEKLKAIRQKDLEKIKTPMNIKGPSPAQAPRKQKAPEPDMDWKEVVRQRARQG